MEVDERYKILFEPVKIGPVVAPNRFYPSHNWLTMWHALSIRKPLLLMECRGIC